MLKKAYKLETIEINARSCDRGIHTDLFINVCSNKLNNACFMLKINPQTT